MTETLLTNHPEVFYLEDPVKALEFTEALLTNYYLFYVEDPVEALELTEVLLTNHPESPRGLHYRLVLLADKLKNLR